MSSRYKSGRGSRRRSKRSFAATKAPIYARVAIPLVLVLLIGRLLWHTTASRVSSHVSAAALEVSAPAPWQRDIADALTESLRDVKAGNTTAATVSIDRTDSLLTAARLQQFPAQPQFFAGVDTVLDRVLQQGAFDTTLFAHVTEARIALADLRSSLEGAATDSRLDEESGSGALGSVDPAVATTSQRNETPVGNTLDSKPVRLTGPRQIAAHQTVDLRSLGANYLDATFMAESSEVLIPPATRSFESGIRVENITINGAAQTLDGIRWRNVTFIGTRIRYESGDLDLENVRFVRCRFGLPSDERGARVASAVATGQASITIQ